MILDFIPPDFKKEGNMYNAIYNNIKSAVLCGAIKKGEKMPSIREAAKQLGVSRTTVENAYSQLCIEGIAESRPNKGYFIIGTENRLHIITRYNNDYINKIKYDFSSRRIDTDSADTENWKTLVRQVLRNSEELISYGDSQGELGLREALAAYSYKARGVVADADNIVIGAGIGPLLNILCGIMGRNITVGIENGSFKAAESVFSDYGIEALPLEGDNNGALIKDIEEKNINVLFLMPSSLSKISINGISNRRMEFNKWVKEKENRIIIEDDYNGELRYTARTLPAFQGKAPDNCIYIGSFSKLLLPSVRIAYMVLPSHLTEIFRNKKQYYNQTCGKTEQLALKEYILSGGIEKHLRRLRRLYYSKSQLLCRLLKEKITSYREAVLFETSLTVELKTELEAESKEICQKALFEGLRLIQCEERGAVRLCFAGISRDNIEGAVTLLQEVLEKIQ